MEGTEPGTGGVDVRQSELSQVQCPGRGAEPRSMSMGRMCVSLGMRELWTALSSYRSKKIVHISI